MAQTFRPFYCNLNRFVPELPKWDVTVSVSLPIITWAVMVDGEHLFINGEFATVDSAFISREYAGIRYEEDVF